MLTRPPSSRLESACSSDEVLKVLVVLDTLTMISARQFLILTEDPMGNNAKVRRVISFLASKFSLPLWLPSKPLSVVVDTLLDVEVEEPEVEKLSAKRA